LGPRAVSDPQASMRLAPTATSRRGAITRYVIHGGRHEIGGMCIEVAADDAST
jgi:hypothetical protein